MSEKNTPVCFNANTDAARDSVKGKRVLIVGMARSGVAAAELAVREQADVTICDLKSIEAFENKLDSLKELPIHWALGEDGIERLKNADLLIISPGVPIDAPVVNAAKQLGVQVIGEMEFAYRFAPCTMVAVTGTNGKTTTVSLLGDIFKEAGKLAYVAGNIGYPLSAAVLKSMPEDVLVAEVSSFQLETTEKFHPCAAAVLNVTEDHLNRHGTMEKYIALKHHIFDAMNERDVAVLNYDDEICRRMAQELKPEVAFFSRKQTLESGAFVSGEDMVIRWKGEEKTICKVSEIRIPGPHNLENALAAAMLSYARGVPAPVIRHSLRTFAGVEHRIEFTRELDGVRYINDSKGTNVDSTIKAIETMQAPTVLILGGYDKHVSFLPLAQSVMRSGMITHCVLIGVTALQIEKALRETGYTAIEHAGTMQEAVEKSRTLAVEGGNVLLSPACASFDMFSDYEQRGKVFKQIVNDLK